MSDRGAARAAVFDEHAAIARVATLVATGAEPADIFAAVSWELHHLFRLGPDLDDVAVVVRFDREREHVVLGMSRDLDTVHATLEEGALALRVSDNGVGGVDPGRGSGILGIKDRVEALGGSVSISIPKGEGTELHVLLPSPTDTATLLRAEEGDHG
jgi:hypothetical protein